MAAPSAAGRGSQPPAAPVAAATGGRRRLSPSTLGWVAAAALSALLLGALAWATTMPAARAADPRVGRAAPELTIQSLEGSRLNLAELRGRPVVLNFWASWCVQCRQEAPALRSAAEAYRGRVEFVGANVEDSEGGARSFETEFRPGYPVGPVTGGSYLSYGVRGIPETLLIDARGVIVWRLRGPADASLEAEIGRRLT